MTAETGKSMQETQADRQKLQNNLYGLADSIGCTLYISSQYKDEWLGCQPRTAQLGPWSVSISNAAWSDQVTNDGCSMFVKIKGDVWAYVMMETGRLSLVLLDGKAAGLSRDKAPTYGEHNIDSTLSKIDEFSFAWFRHSKDGWKQVDKQEF